METLKSPHGNFIAYINRLHSPEEDLFHISFVDSSNKLHVILMHRLNHQWTFLNEEGFPHWIIELQPQLHDLITQKLLKEHLAIAI